MRPEESRDEYSLDLLGGTEPTTRGDEVASPSEIQDDVTRPELGFLRSRPHPTRRRHRLVVTGHPIPSSIVAADLLHWPSSRHSGRAGGRGRARVQRPELDDRPWQTRVVRNRLVKDLSVGIATGQLLFMHQRTSTGLKHRLTSTFQGHIPRRDAVKGPLLSPREIGSSGGNILI